MRAQLAGLRVRRLGVRARNQRGVACCGRRVAVAADRAALHGVLAQRARMRAHAARARGNRTHGRVPRLPASDRVLTLNAV